MPNRLCSECGGPLPPPTQGRPRTKCETCSPPRLRDVKRRAPHKLGPLPDAPSAPVAGVYDAVLAELTDADRVQTVAGQRALFLAARMESNIDSGASMAALDRQLGAAVAEAVKNAKRASDPLDEIRRRREERSRGA